jgi:hypothetical protein
MCHSSLVRRPRALTLAAWALCLAVTLAGVAAGTGRTALHARAAFADNQTRLYTLDGWGGIHAVGTAAPVVAGDYWPGWDIARGLVVRGDGASGYVLDGWGGVHPFGGAPAVTVTGYWPGWDIARGIVLGSDGVSGYVLDGWGALHPFGDAVPVTVSDYWPGWDVARGAVSWTRSTQNAPGGWVLDGLGGVHTYGLAPALQASENWDWDIARGLGAVTIAPS